MKRLFSVWDRRKCAIPYPLNRLPPLLSPPMACCCFRANWPSAIPPTACCLNPNGLLVPRALGPQLNNSFINSALKSGAAASASTVSPASPLTCLLPPSLRNALSLSLLLSAMPMADSEKAKAERMAIGLPVRNYDRKWDTNISLDAHNFQAQLL